MVNPVSYDTVFNTDVLVNMGATLLLFVFMFTGKKASSGSMGRSLFLAAYAGYVTFLIIRNNLNRGGLMKNCSR